MAENINIDIVINAANAAKTIKEQKDALKELNKALGEVKEGSGAFELLSDSANQLKKSMDTLTLSFEDVYGEGVKPLTSQMGELEDRMYAMALAGQQNSEEFRTLQAETIRMRKAIIDVDETVDAFAQKGARLQGFIGIAQGIAGGFAVAQSAAALFGSENEKLEKSIVKVASVIELLSGLEALSTSLKQKNVVISSIQNGIRAITVRLVGQQAVAEAAAAAATNTATIAQKGLNAAMAANPIGLLIVAATTLFSVMMLWGDSNDKTEKTQEELNAELEKTIDLTEQYNNLGIGGLADRQKEIELLKAKGATNKEIYNAEKDLINEQIASLESLKDATTDNTKFLQFESNIRNLRKDLEILDIEYAKKAKEASKKAQEDFTTEQEKKVQDYKQYIEHINEFDEQYYKRLKKLRENIYNLNLEGYDKELNALIISNNDAVDVVIDSFEKEQKFLNEALNKKLISKKEYDLRNLELQKKSDNEIAENFKLTQLKQSILTEDINENTLNLQKDYNIKRIELLSNNLEKLYELEKSTIDSSIFITADKNKALLDLDIRYKEQRKKIAEDLYDSENILALKNYRKTLSDLEESLKLNLLRETEYSKKKEDIDKQISDTEAFLSRERTDAERKSGEEALALFKLNQASTITLIKSTNAIIQNDKEKIKTADITYDNEKITSARKLNKTLTDLEKDTTVKTEEELKKRQADYENFAAAAADAVLGLLGAAFDSITESRVAAIDREKQAQLDAIQTEEDAYLKSTEKKTNAEKFKADKQNEFARKKAEIEAKYEKQKAEAQYKNEVRQWEFSLASATVNFANAILKSAPNPFLLATTGVLGLLQLATITANRPVKTFGKGGLLDGPSHSNGGIATPYGEMEGGEAVINKASTKKFLPILSAINEAGGGVPLVNTSMMANGGVTNVNNNNVDMSNVELLLQSYFNRPIKTYVTSSDVTTAQGVDRRLNDRTSF